MAVLGRFYCIVLLKAIKLNTQKICLDSAVYIGQFSKFAMKFKKKSWLKIEINFFESGLFFQGRSGKGKQIKFEFRPKGKTYLCKQLSFISLS